MKTLQVYFHEDGLEFNDALGVHQGHIDWNKASKIQKDFWEKKGISPTQVAYLQVHICHPHFLLIPQKYDSPIYRIGFLEKALGEEALVGREIQVQKIPSEAANLLFLVLSEWKDLLSYWFPFSQISYQHPLETLIIQSQENGLSISIHHQQACMVLRKSGILTLANIFPFAKATELAFYIHSIRDSYFIKWNPSSIYWVGEIDAKWVEELSSLKIYTPTFSHEA
ncbi:DUF3822 family protein [Aquirufa salirivi]|uniref:DUF3822 family protein n=1 Tax=Aquirufa salirivi TaxID=3104729 RepID=A0ABW8RYM7_9BACT